MNVACTETCAFLGQVAAWRSAAQQSQPTGVLLVLAQVGTAPAIGDLEEKDRIFSAGKRAFRALKVSCDQVE